MYKALQIDLLGQHLLITTLSSAYYAITHKSDNNNEVKKGQECIAFINDSGIHNVVTIFNLHLDPDKVQNLFYYYIEVA